MIVSGSKAKARVARQLECDDEVLASSERGRVVRRFSSGKTIVYKYVFGPDAAAKVRREREILERLRDVPGVVKLANVEQSDEAIALQDDGGVPLSDVLQGRGLPVATLVEFALRIAETIAAMHRAGVVHHDINPSNILSLGSRRPVLIDFHIASSHAEERPAFTAQSEIAGTFAYIAPEQTGRTGRPMDRRSDLYSFGATLYEFATGRPPFESGEAFELIRDHLTRLPAPPLALAPNLPLALSDIIMRLLQKEPDARYQSADGLTSDLMRLQERLAHGVGDSFPLGERDFPDTLLPPSRLVGREVEIAALHDAFEGVLSGRGGGFFVAGAPGVGKTALINELRSAVTVRGGYFVTGKFDQLREDADADGVSRALRALFRLLLAEPEEELASTRARLGAALGSNASFLASVLPELSLLLGIRPETEIGDPANTRDRLVQAGLAAVRSIASPARPLVFVVDDLQWAYATPLRFIDAVLDGYGVPGLLLVGAYRAADVDSAHPLAALLARWERSSAPVHRLQLHNLFSADLTQLLREMLRLPPSAAAALAAAVNPRTCGNPFDTVEFINALRREGVLRATPEGWTWDDVSIHRYVGSSDVTELLNARIDTLPPASRSLLELVACLGDDVERATVAVAAACSFEELDDRLRPPLEAGLLVLDHDRVLRFRHDRVGQAAYGRLDGARRHALHLALARRLSGMPGKDGVVAEQYLRASGSVESPSERIHVACVFRDAAKRASLVANHLAAERFLSAALELVADVASNAAIVAELENDLHETFCTLGRFEEADAIYRRIEGRGDAAVSLVAPACIQISSLTNRKFAREAVDLAVGLLRRLVVQASGGDGAFEVQIPPDDDLDALVDNRLDEIYRWFRDEAGRQDDFLKPEASGESTLSGAKIIARMMPAAFHCGVALQVWLVLESLRIWSHCGPRRELVAVLGRAGHLMISLRADYRTAYQVAYHFLEVSKARGYEPETSLCRFFFALRFQPLFDSFEDSLVSARSAHEGLVRGGDLVNASFAYGASLAALVQCAANLEEHALEAEAAISLTVRTGNRQFESLFFAHRQFARCLQGRTSVTGEFFDASYDERKHSAAVNGNLGALAYFSILQALAAMIFGETASLLRHTDTGVPLLRHLTSLSTTALAHLVRAVAAAARYRGNFDAGRERFGELEDSLEWLRARANDAPFNFAHMVALVEAERAWALGDHEAASTAFEAAMRAARATTRPRDRAFIAERAGRFYLEREIEGYASYLLAQARRDYAAYGALAKVRQLERDFPFISSSTVPKTERQATTAVSSETIDMVGLLRASQALSSETSLESLKVRVAELLATLTGATDVLLVVRDDEPQRWSYISEGTEGIPVAEAGARGCLPLTAFRYAERTLEPLLVEDAMRDDRFSRDPRFAGCAQCSLLVVPILSQGVPRAVVILENRLGRAAFSTERLDVVLLVAGQLAVSLDNAMLYASLERKVAERTEALAAANEQLARLSRTDALTGLVNRRGFDERFEREWQRAKRSGTPLGLVLIDVDEFKKYNDHYGHQAGDACLQRVATTMRDQLRPGSDLAARYGGEEFALVLPNTDAEGTRAVTERVREAVAARRDPHERTRHGIVTISLGCVALVPGEADVPADYFKAADLALFEAKRNGRNRAVLAPSDART